MRIVDLNILLYAVNSDAAQHDFIRSWWEKALNDEDTVGLTWVVLLGFLRFATNSRVFPRPLAPDVAAAKLDAWLSLDNVRVVREKDDHWETLRSLLRDAGTAGNQDDRRTSRGACVEPRCGARFLRCRFRALQGLALGEPPRVIESRGVAPPRSRAGSRRS